MDRSRDHNYCRLSHWSKATRKGWLQIQMILRDMDRVYRETLPLRYAEQQQVIQATHPHWIIKGTVFTTGTINNTEVFQRHRDKNNLPTTMSVMAVLTEGDYEGGLLVFPKHRIAVDMQDRDVIIFDGRTLVHGNTQIIGQGERISIVAYYRAGVLDAGSPAEERAKKADTGKANRLK
jgi:hypothetical protein